MRLRLDRSGSMNRCIDMHTHGRHTHTATANRSIEPVRICRSTQPRSRQRASKSWASPSPRSSSPCPHLIALRLCCSLGCGGPAIMPSQRATTTTCTCGLGWVGGGWIPVLPSKCNNRVAGACLGALGVGFGFRPFRRPISVQWVVVDFGAVAPVCVTAEGGWRGRSMV